MLDAGAVVPAAVHQHDFTAGRQVRNVALEVPLGTLAVGGLGQRYHVALARVEVFGDGLDGAALAGGIAAFQQHQHALPGVLYPARHRGEFQLHRFQQGLVLLALELAHPRASLVQGKRRA
ncbi:hypothetical protein D3C71_1727160 [compost metagenome]